MPRRINNVNFHAVIFNGRIFGHDSDSLFPLQSIRIHNQVTHRLVLSEDFALLKHCIHKRRFTMVNMSDDCDISNIIALVHIQITLPLKFHRSII